VLRRALLVVPISPASKRARCSASTGRSRALRVRCSASTRSPLLVLNAGRVLTRDVSIDRVWGANYVGDTKTLDVHVKRLRRRIEEDPHQPRLIVTVRGVGYKFTDA
jgi:DNA-binding response OmpR family regulator